LNDNFLAGLQHFGNELRAAVRFVPRVAVLRRLVGTSAGAAASALGAASAAHGTLKAGARLFGNANARGRLSLARMRRFGSLVKFFVSFYVGFLLNSGVAFSVAFSMLFSVLGRVSFAVLWAVLTFVTMFGGRFRGHRFIMHFVGEGVGILCRFLMIVVLISFAISFLISVQRFLQLFEFGGFDVRFGHRFDRLGPLFGIGLRFFVFGLGKLFGEGAYVFLGEARAIRGMRLR
jgi:hypothetical protein